MQHAGIVGIEVSTKASDQLSHKPLGLCISSSTKLLSFTYSLFVSIYAYLITSVVHLNIISIHIDILVGIVENMCCK